MLCSIETSATCEPKSLSTTQSLKIYLNNVFLYICSGHYKNKPLLESQNLPRGCKCWCLAVLCQHCCAPARTEPLRQEVLGRWRSGAGCHASAAAPTSSSNWVGARTRVGPGEEQEGRRGSKNGDLQILRWKEIIGGIPCFSFFWDHVFSKRIVI